MITKVIDERPKASIILKRETLKAFPLKSGQGCPLSPLLLSIVLETLPRTNKRRKLKGYYLEKRSRFAEDMTLYLGDPKNSTRRLAELKTNSAK